MAREIATRIEISAPPEAVWAVLTDFPRFGEWNEFLPKVDGKAIEGSRIRFVFELPRGFKMKATAEVLRVEPDRELRWAGTAPIPGLLRAEHYFLLSPAGDGATRFDHGERFTGPLAVLLWPILRRRGTPVYEQMNRDLKRRVEEGT